MTFKGRDTISFKPKHVLFVPTTLNRKSRLATHVKKIKKFEFHETNVVTDWDGVFIDSTVRDIITPGSVVRIQSRLKGTLYGDVWYARVLEMNGDEIYGELLDYSKTDPGDFDADSMRPGLILKFAKRNIIEIPLMWNPQLKAAEKLRDRERMGYAITGYRGEGTYSVMENDEQ